MRLLWLLFSGVLLAQFEYDPTAPLRARQEPLAERPVARMWRGSFHGGKINYVLVEPKLRGRMARARQPGVVFQHGGGQSMSNYISEALLLAELGVTSLLVDAAPPSSRETLVDLVITQRRGVDLLLREGGVDGKRIGYVGHSYGSMAGGILGGVEPRIAAFVLLGAAPSLAKHIRESSHVHWAPMKILPDYERVLTGIAEVDPENYLPRMKAALLVQCARFDTPENLQACPEVHRLAGGPKTLRWYEDDHNFTSYDAMRDRYYWLAGQLKVRGAEAALARWVKRK